MSVISGGWVTDRMELRLVSEDEPGWLRKVANLALSARVTPGEMVEVPMIAHIVDGRRHHAYGGLRALGVDTVAAPVIEKQSPLNKITMFRAADPAKCLVALDCDLLLAAEFPGAARADRVCAVPASFPLLSDKTWRSLYGAMRLPLLESPMTSTVSQEPIPVPYLNSGVVIMPGRWGEQLSQAWLYYARVVRRHPTIPGWSAVHEFHLEQVALACALSFLGLPLLVLPVEYNAPFELRDLRRVRVLHYHGQINQDGTVRQPLSPVAAAVVRQFNETLRRSGLAGADWPAD
jgi:hypothetical protein